MFFENVWWSFNTDVRVNSHSTVVHILGNRRLCSSGRTGAVSGNVADTAQACCTFAVAGKDPG